MDQVEDNRERKGALDSQRSKLSSEGFSDSEDKEIDYCNNQYAALDF